MFRNVPQTLVVDNWVGEYAPCLPESRHAVYLHLALSHQYTAHWKKSQQVPITNHFFVIPDFFKQIVLHF